MREPFTPREAAALFLVVRTYLDSGRHDFGKDDLRTAVSKLARMYQDYGAYPPGTAPRTVYPSENT